jgi:hypothetical protein
MMLQAVDAMCREPHGRKQVGAGSHNISSTLNLITPWTPDPMAQAHYLSNMFIPLG